ncbi:sodium/glutamate symporter [Salisediminibacterium selenitireducens]|uniref:Sodium/glutamate symporter n=1 Tax=Bacillus selenitireducens (strain ATCC 700615 / DSM 15326 / MLS10) TaxID=439292 RepID=D6XWE7_BACIE|nr:sodium/glutamate symporter [Salisediminibacterium selenitireducens]ADH97789.1 sodium/glutamate symporter [[Bacillus] selenitireducens MLS10]
MELDVVSGVMRAIFFTFILISVFLLIGAYLRAKVKIIQNLFLPASVVGGLLGLILGPIVLRDYAVLPIPDDWLMIASLLPGLLIVPVVASVPLGLKMKQTKSSEEGGSGSNGSRAIVIMFLILGIIAYAQTFYSLSVASVFKNVFSMEGIYPTFGTELSAGFTGGHGTAGVIGSLLQSMDQPYWNTAQGVTTTVATVGIISGILIGILFINIAVRKGFTTFVQSGSDMQGGIRTGLNADEASQESAGHETTNSSSIDSMGFHLALILMVSGLAFGIRYVFDVNNVLILNMIPEWAYAILLMYGVWGIMIKMKLDWIVDVKTKTKIASTFTEYAVVAAIISLPIQAVFALILPLSIILIGGLAITVLLAYFLSKRYFKEYWFEKSMAILGTNTGVFLTGLLLLKMVDPDLKSPVLRDYSISYSLNSLIGFVLFPLAFGFLIAYGYTSAILLYGSLGMLFVIGLIIVGKKDKQEVQSI